MQAFLLINKQCYLKMTIIDRQWSRHLDCNGRYETDGVTFTFLTIPFSTPSRLKQILGFIKRCVEYRNGFSANMKIWLEAISIWPCGVCLIQMTHRCDHFLHSSLILICSLPWHNSCNTRFLAPTTFTTSPTNLCYEIPQSTSPALTNCW